MISLITGGAGFIGSNLCGKLLSLGHIVICLDNFDDYYSPAIKRKNISNLLENDSFTLVEASILDDGILKNIVSENSVDYIFHEAAQPGVRISVENPMKPFETNIHGTLNILNAALNSNVKKIINASSSSVYGKTYYLPYDEKHPTEPVSPYGVSKLAAEHYCRVYNELYGLKTTSLRYFTVYGPRMRPDLAISIFTENALNNEPIEIFGDGTKTRDFTNIDDIVEANLLSMTKGDNEIFNIGGGHRISIQELVESIIEITDSKSTISYSGNIKGDAQHTHSDSSFAKTELNWEPKTSLKDGINKYIEFIANQQRGNINE